jgi:DHA1 family tetracycline resistance protein-like MFS transporter
MSMIGAPILGRWSDRWGRRPVLLVSIFGTFLGFLVLGFANTLWLVFLSRIIDGATGGNFAVAQAYVTDVTDETNRAKGLGMIGAAFGVGFIVGPAIGGALSLWSYSAPAFFAAGLTLVNLVMVYMLLPESLSRERRAELAARKRASVGWSDFLATLRRPLVGPLLQIRFFFGLAFGVFESMFPLYADTHMHLSAHATSFLLVYMGIFLVGVQGGAMGKLSARFGDAKLIFGSLVLLGISLAGWAVSPNLIWIMIVLIPMAVAGGVLNTVIRSALSKSVPGDEVGGIMGIGASLGSLTRVIAPALGGFLVGATASAPGIFGAAISIWLVYYAWRELLAKPEAERLARPVEQNY